jgi:hypothetical protein
VIAKISKTTFVIYANEDRIWSLDCPDKVIKSIQFLSVLFLRMRIIFDSCLALITAIHDRIRVIGHRGRVVFLRNYSLEACLIM